MSKDELPNDAGGYVVFPKRVSFVVAVALVIQIASGFWYAAKTEAKLDYLDLERARTSVRLEKLELDRDRIARLEEQMKLQTDILKEIRSKLDQPSTRH